MSLQAKETELYSEMWALDVYRQFSPGEKVLPIFLEMSQAQPTSYVWVDRKPTVLDAGAGAGKGALALVNAGFDVTLCDLTADGLEEEARVLPFRKACLWDDLRSAVGRYDYAYCCDVLEHLPTEFTMLAIHQLLGVARYGVFLSIGLIPDQHGVWVGQHLHQTIRPFEWWRDRMREICTVVECRDLRELGVYYIRG